MARLSWMATLRLSAYVFAPGGESARVLLDRLSQNFHYWHIANYCIASDKFEAGARGKQSCTGKKPRPACRLAKEGNAAQLGLVGQDGSSAAVSTCFLRLSEESAHILLGPIVSQLILSADCVLSSVFR